MTALVWEELPPSKRGRTDWVLIARELRSNPGRWALVSVARSANTAARQLQRVRKGAAAGFTVGEFEAARRDTKIYARYVGPGGAGS